MGKGFMVIEEKDWEKADPERRDWMIFNTLRSINCRLEKLEKKDRFYKFCVSLGVVMGGAITWLLGNWGGIK
jgi:hypothetical protein